VLWVEKAHVRELIKRVEATVEATLDDLRELAPERSHDLLFDLPPAAVVPAIIFRDFPKRHGNRAFREGRPILVEKGFSGGRTDFFRGTGAVVRK
jgi:hypothetical protein